jgi:HEAT repeat protein
MSLAYLVVSAVVGLSQTPAVPPAPAAPAPAAPAAPAAWPSAPALAPVAAALEIAAPVWDGDDRQGRDPGDSLYREARRLLNRNRYADAAAKFKEFREKNAGSPSVAEALYFEAFALYRGGDINQLREARARLQEQETKFPRAATRGDARTLRVRVLQSLAERGDETAAVEIRRIADSTGARSSTSVSASSKSEARALAEQERALRATRVKPGKSSNSSCDGDDDEDMRLMALNALMQMNSEDALPVLKTVLAKRDAGSVCLRRRAVFIVSQKRSSEASSLLLDAARNDPDLEVRMQAVQWLSQVRSPEAIPALDSILRSARDIELQEKAVFALSQIRDERAAAVLRTYAERSDVPVAIRERTIFWLGQQRSQDNAAFLRQLYGKLQNEELKEKVLFSLSQMREQGNEKWLLDLAANDREPIEIRKRALFYAGQANAPLADLAAIYDRTRDREMKEQLIFVYSQRRGTEAVDKLLDIARKETDPELRRKAIFWLGQSRDPRAAQFLLDLINQP